MKKALILICVIMVFLSVPAGCAKDSGSSSEGYSVVATTTMLADLAAIIAGEEENINVHGLMGHGIDPHLYKASAGDVNLIQDADLVIINGLHLEGKMGEIFEDLEKQGKLVVEIGEYISEDLLIDADEGKVYDPHVWFDVRLWKIAAQAVKEGFADLDPENASVYGNNYTAYTKELDNLHEYVLDRVNELPQNSRVLITAHDAFSYFGNAYGFEVKGLQGISTASEAGTADVSELAEFIVRRKIKAVFVETSVSGKNIEALQEAVKAREFFVSIGGELFSDSLGNPDSDAGTYIGTVRSNIDTIVDALK